MSERGSAAGTRIPSLDGLRALSIVFVFAGHLTGTRNFPKALNRIGGFAELGVRVFFVISGYLITSLLLADWQRMRDGALSASQALRLFYLRRIYRIFPAAYALVLTVAVLSLAGVVTLLPGDLLSAATYTTNFHQPRSWWLGHLWSLSVEEQFYLLWPAVVLLFGPRRASAFAVASLVAAPACRVLLWMFAPGLRSFIGEAFPTIFDALAAGCILTLIRARLDANATYLRLLQSPAFVVVPVLVVGAALVSNHPRVDLVLGQGVENLGIALIIDRSIRFPLTAWGRFLNRRSLVFIGVLSYSLYLWQQLFVNRHSSALVASFPLNVVVAIGVAIASHKLIEQPFLRLRGRRVAPSALLEGRADPVAAGPASHS